MKILLTGGAGFVGTHLAKLLRTHKVPHLALDDFSTGHIKQLGDSAYVKADISDAAALDAVFTKYRPDTVIHLAALATLGDCAARPADCLRINVEGTRTLLDAMVKHKVRDMVFASSCAVYTATDAGIRLDETIELNPDSLYGKSKLAGERLLAKYRKKHGLRTVAFRIFNVAGADPEGTIGEDHSPETHLLPLAITAALGQRPALEIFGNDYPTPDRTAVRDYIHVCDIAEAFRRGAEYLKNDGAPVALNLGSGIATSVREILAAVEKHTRKKVPAVERPRRAGDAPWLVANAEALKKTLNWEPEQSTLDNVVASALAWHKKTKPR